MTNEVRSFTTSDGTRLALHWDGPQDAPLTLVLSHGWTLDSRCWAAVADRVRAGSPGLRVLRFDHRGHGQSDPTEAEKANIAQLADDLAELLRGGVTGPVVLAGHSMGGMTIMALAERHPELVAERVRGAVFVSTSSGDLIPFDLGVRPALARLLAKGEALLLRFRPAVERFRRQRMTAKRAGLIRFAVRWLLFGKNPRRADVVLATRMIAEGRPAALVDFRPTFDDHDRTAALAEFAGVPTVVLGGDSDRLTPFRHAKVIADELPHATLVRYPDVGHMVPLERAEDVAEQITELLGSVEADQSRRAG
jgi:pimeloyl-ACP methyl ester carboxylesterase